MLLLWITGKVVKLTGNYEPIFIMAGLAYLLALLIVHVLVPKLQVADVEGTNAPANANA